MKHFTLEGHASHCVCEAERLKGIIDSGDYKNADDWLKGMYQSAYLDHCRSTEIIFYHDADFYIVTYNKCRDYLTKYETYENWLKQIIGSTKKSYFSVRRGNANNDLKELRLSGIKLKNTIDEVNYTYSNAVGKQYAISTKVRYMDAIVDQDRLDDNYLKALAYIKGRPNEKYFTYVINTLYSLNSFYVDESEIVKSIDEITKLINKKTRQNEKHKTSQQ